MLTQCICASLGHFTFRPKLHNNSNWTIWPKYLLVVVVYDFRAPVVIIARGIWCCFVWSYVHSGDRAQVSVSVWSYMCSPWLFTFNLSRCSRIYVCIFQRPHSLSSVPRLSLLHLIRCCFCSYTHMAGCLSRANNMVLRG